jgi:hypothetical protein
MNQDFGPNFLFARKDGVIQVYASSSRQWNTFDGDIELEKL